MSMFGEELAKRHRESRESGRYHIPWIECADGFGMSVQVGYGKYCDPRRDFAQYYSKAEIGFPSEKEDLIMDYVENPDNPTGTVYGYVPIHVIEAVIAKHGGEKKDDNNI